MLKQDQYQPMTNDWTNDQWTNTRPFSEIDTNTAIGPENATAL